ncbi:SIR2-like protein [Streptomyces puniciscabiei]|uniref:SIR2-like protein n=1 Tax=Streptomyces puniciscabiei TaxID=164348 RepID=A0A542TGU8_9ACTN|nr:SIR2 family protein [Streptomyces puniciscabiei]TQK86043.1 SIR2-like protein [Streptomyces puniciscabiei]
MEPHVMLAFALRATPGGYAVLLGAGVSLAAGLPSAWDVQKELIEQIAAAEAAGEIGDPFAWYQDRFGKPATYDDLLATLTATQMERQALLRGYFEPDDADREQGKKKPTAAHHAVARLASAGLVRIVLTTNFDRLIETALSEAGIEPTVVAHPDDITGLAPLHTINCLVVHVHGDYLNPTSMLNTADELDHYQPQVDKLLDRIFDDYGLIIAGWSAQWDLALRNALARCTTRRFASYWADPGILKPEAKNLLNLRAGTFVQADADAFFGQVADATQALADVERRHPTSVAVAVATAKRSLAGSHTAISLHDTIRREFQRVAALPVNTSGPWDGFTDANAEHTRRVEILRAESELLLALVATAAYWGNNTTDRWWIRSIEELATPVSSGGNTALLQLKRAPATMVTYAAGIAALAAERWTPLAQVLTQPMTHNPYNNEVLPVAVALGPAVFGMNDTARGLYEQLRSVFTDHLALSESAYQEAWERFDYLRLFTQTHAKLSVDYIPYTRRSGMLGAYTVAPMEWLDKAIAEAHPLLQAAFPELEPDQMCSLKHQLDDQLNQLLSQAFWTAGGRR